MKKGLKFYNFPSNNNIKETETFSEHRWKWCVRLYCLVSSGKQVLCLFIFFVSYVPNTRTLFIKLNWHLVGRSHNLLLCVGIQGQSSCCFTAENRSKLRTQFSSLAGFLNKRQTLKTLTAPLFLHGFLMIFWDCNFNYYLVGRIVRKVCCFSLCMTILTV